MYQTIFHNMKKFNTCEYIYICDTKTILAHNNQIRKYSFASMLSIL